MTWFKVDDRFPEHPKLEAVLDEPRLYAEVLALWLSAGCYCARNLTDGRVPKSALRALVPFAAAKAAAALVDAGLWIDDGKAYLFHDWTDYQPTREQVLREREAARERMRKARRSSPERSPEQGPVFARTEPERSPEVREPRPVPSRPEEIVRTPIPDSTDAREPTDFELVEREFGALRVRLGKGTWKSNRKHYDQTLSAAETLRAEADRRRVPLVDVVRESLDGFGRDAWARSAGYPAGAWLGDPGKYLGQTAEEQLQPAQRKALEEQLAELQSKIRYESREDRAAPLRDEIARVREQLDIKAPWSGGGPRTAQARGPGSARDVLSGMFAKTGDGS